ncbi:RluA family pseudouridine synthase [Cohnella thermotolerans]|uniref:RluA family pseudouridine synthase n=1 Tax=Cohnella thermotolerans TaxID=329858 RepID=UPI00040A2D78|nr:RluA family pseudouridine synthase [Cohnella thermotolerans]
MITRMITASESGKRLHRYLRNLMPNLPLGQIYKMIDQGKAKVNGKRKNQNYELAAGDELTLYVDESQFAEASKGQKKTKYIGVNANIDVVYEDEQLLVVAKPAGVLTHPDRSDQKDTLINRVHAYLYRKGELDSALFMPATANRLDRNTSGLVLIGKTAGMLHQLNQWIQKHELEKYYITIVEGKLEGEGTLSANLIRDERSNRTFVAGDPSVSAKRGGTEQEKSAVTRYRALQSARGYSLVEVELVSGRTHQIRSHFQSIGHSLLGDVKYGGKPFAGVNHQLLHAWRIRLPDGREFRAPLPALMRRTIERAGLSLSALSAQ